MAVPPLLGSSYLRKLSKNIGGKLKRLSRPLISGGIGDKMDKGNLWIVPGFTILIFACLWTTKLSKVALEESTCRGASIYDFTGTQLDQDAQRHCQTARRYYVAPEEPLLYDYKWKLDRQVKNPEWILWFWAPIVFIMYVITRFIWSLLLDNQGINFPNVVNAAESVTVENDGIIEIDEEKLNERLNVIAENFRCSTSSRAFSAFIAFEFSLVLAPICLLIFVLPIMIGPNYRSWGLDVIKAWWERKDWQGVSLTPVLGFQSPELGRPSVPLIPRITYCDYQFVSIGNSHTLTYRCYLDANWHERTALFIWIMLVFLTIVNFLNLIFWIEWAIRMKFKKPRRRWVLRKWLNTDEFLTEHEMVLIRKFASTFRTGNLLLFYYIEAHSSRVVASAFCIALFRRWLDRRAALLSNNPHPRGDSVGDGDASFNGQKPKEPIGWKLDPEEGDGLAPSPSEYYSPLETGESPENTMPFISPQHRYTDSSDSSNSKPEKGTKFATSAPSFLPGETPRGTGTGRPQFPRRGGHYSKNLREASREPLKPGGSGIKGKAPIMSSKERRRLEKEREKEKRRKEQQKGGGIEMLQEEENINGERSGRENRRFGCAVM